MMTVLSVRVGAFSSALLGALVVGWAAMLTRDACASSQARTWGIVTAFAATGLVTAGLVAPTTPTGAVVESLLGFVVLGAVVCLWTATASEFGLRATSRWRWVRGIVWPSAVALGVVGYVVVSSGRSVRGASGVTVRLGESDLALPRWAWIVTGVGLVPLVAMLIVLLVAVVTTYRELIPPATNAAGS